MRLLVCGGRDYEDRESMFAVLNVLNPALVIHGDCKGADKIAGEWADMNLIAQARCTVTQHDYDRYGKSAPVIRNQQMLTHWEPTLILAVQGGKGTDDMVRRAKKACVPVVRLI